MPEHSMKSYREGTAFPGRIAKVDVDLKPDFDHDPEEHADARAKLAMVAQ
jgi:hypothetical protein